MRRSALSLFLLSSLAPTHARPARLRQHPGALQRTLALRGGSAPYVAPPASAPVDALAPGKPMLTLEAADAMASAALEAAKLGGFKDISVCVMDTSGRVLVSKTMLGCPRLIPDIARAKAGCVIGTHSSSRALRDKYVPDRTPQLLTMTTMGFATNQVGCTNPILTTSRSVTPDPYPDTLPPLPVNPAVRRRARRRGRARRRQERGWRDRGVWRLCRRG